MIYQRISKQTTASNSNENLCAYRYKCVLVNIFYILNLEARMRLPMHHGSCTRSWYRLTSDGLTVC